MKEIIIDLETLGTKPGAVVLTIGAAEFDRAKQEIVSTFYERIDLFDAFEAGMQLDPDTLQWWYSERVTQQARFEAFEAGPRGSVKEVLTSFANWLGDPANCLVWGKGPSFDCGILGAAYDLCDMTRPWMHYSERCLRTERDFHERRGVTWQWKENPLPHSALHDAVCEAAEVLMAERAMDTAIRGMVSEPSITDDRADES